MAMKLYTHEELLDRDLGPIGTPKRDEFDQKVADEIHAYQVGEAIKQARLAQNLTQEQLGEKIGVQRSKISKLENGESISLSIMTRIFKALGIQVALDLKGIGRLALC